MKKIGEIRSNCEKCKLYILKKCECKVGSKGCLSPLSLCCGEDNKAQISR